MTLKPSGDEVLHGGGTPGGNSTTPQGQRDAQVTGAIREETNRIIGRGAGYGTALGVVASITLLALWLLGEDNFFKLPLVFTSTGTVGMVLLAVLGNRGHLRGMVRPAVVAPLVSLPTGLFLVAHLVLPAGAATYITGPFINLYSFLLVITGFFLSVRVSALAGLLVGAEYLLVFWLARPFLLAIQAQDPTLQQDLTSWAVALNRALILAATGVAVGGISVLVRRLILRVIHTERETAVVNRLFGQYVSEEARLRIVTTTSGLKGERVNAVVLFSDLRGFSTFSEGRDPQEVVERLNAYFEEMVTAVHRCGGVVDKFIGDAVMATFGALNPMTQPALAALQAAREMRAGLARLNAQWASRGLAPFDHGIGLHLGEVVVGPIGSTARKDFTVIGDPVNTASRVEGLCKEKGVHVIISDVVYRALPPEEQAHFQALGSTPIKGRQEPLVLWGTDAQ